MKAPELLLPAGGLERMRAAYDYGADAVYAGSPRYSLRARNNEFAKLDVLEQGIKEAHERNKKFFFDRQHPAAQFQTQNLRRRHGAADCHETRRADYGGSGFDYDRARKMAGNADPPVRTGKHHQLLGREILAKHRCRTHYSVTRIEHGRNRRNPPRMP